MPLHEGPKNSNTEGLPVAPSLAPALESLRLPPSADEDRHRIVTLSGIAVLIGLVSAGVAELLVALIALITNLAFYQKLSLTSTSPAGNHLGLLVVLVPVVGGLIVGIMARFGSPAIRGHGIPEAMERILSNESRIAPKITFLKPLSSAVAIGTGGPFGAEGPVIATGGALGSLVGQLLSTTADERKILLAAGAAAGMAAVFGSPVAAVLLAIELLLFEYRARSLVPVALAVSAATSIRFGLHGSAPVFTMTEIGQPGGTALAAYVLLGAIIGLVAVYITRAVYAMEDAFEHLPIHWMWWPAAGGLAVGVFGYISPHTLGVGYDNIEGIVSGALVGRALLFLVIFKLASWTIALGSGTSGGTLAPLFTIGGGIGSLAASGALLIFPRLGIDIRVAGLVGMAAMFAGASRALLTSVVFAFETTRQPMGLLPLLGGCTAAYLVSLLRMRHSIMTERLARRGVPVGTEYSVDYLHQRRVGDYASPDVVSLFSEDTVGKVRGWLAGGASGTTHQGFPVLDQNGRLVGVITRRDLTDIAVGDDELVQRLIKRAPVAISEDHTLRDAADHMVRERVGRLPVVARSDPTKVVGILSRSDLLEAHEQRLDEATESERSIDLVVPWRAGSRSEQ